MTSFLLFKRDVRIVVSTIEITKLSVSFVVNRSIKPEPNTAEIKVYNLNAKHRSELEQLAAVPVSIEAGYDKATTMLFSGELRTAITRQEGPDLITVLSSGDGEKKCQTSRVAVSVAKGTMASTVIKEVAKAIGVGDGNLDDAVKNLQLAKVGNMFSAGTVIYGNAAREMTALCRSVGLTWSVQDGKLQLLPLRQVLPGEAILLSASTGLVGSPTVDNKGVMSCRMLMLPDVMPGRALVLDSKRLKGAYRIEATKHVGFTAGQDWYVDVEARSYATRAT
jgi:hypothetical protein